MTQSYAAGAGTPDDDSLDTAGQVQLNTQGTDDLLDEIDGLLENNAEEFVRSYVQKGGE
ncbi:ubiquitin-like protein Pup [Corynebacterium hindlerae]|uniref:Prokaryotic ubiquitin-like protein Pup n=1 Tax=Corynebacterium hindlerae TaxID=699041 RepID=A0A7G5FFA3_9CORY|nr:ubiquitin-like protein Pup [Corynebacterium hindlerae]QMV85294.1 ubiquitin-like protein Pup [Corynebacterium hindlerae]QTH58823.1 ubiquitin-like protein Pup [Corynebacterium hindlerae]